MSRLPELVRWPVGASEAVLESASLRKLICAAVLRECTEAFGDQLKAVISTGSLARDEASVLRQENSFVVCGDAEFLVVFKKKAALPASLALGQIHRRIEQNILQQNIQCKIDLSAVHPGYFLRLPAHIFTYELKHCGRVIAGDERILETIPDYSPNDLSREDAWRLLCNRLVEMLECAAELTGENQQPSSALRYKIVKLYLDMGASFLVFENAFVPTYRKRCQALLCLAVEKPAITEHPFDLAGFTEIVVDCTEQKLAPGAADEHLTDLSLHAAIRSARALWRWELTQLVGAKEELNDAELFDRWVRRQPFRKNIRGWLYILRTCGWRQSDVVLLRWLNLRKASPRHWIYLIASTLLFQWNAASSSSEPKGQDADLAKLAGCLPINDAAAKNQSKLACENLAAEVFRNYKQFVAGTRA
jgi:hypothetical protein